MPLLRAGIGSSPLQLVSSSSGVLGSPSVADGEEQWGIIRARQMHIMLVAQRVLNPAADERQVRVAQPKSPGPQNHPRNPGVEWWAPNGARCFERIEAWTHEAIGGVHMSTPAARRSLAMACISPSNSSKVR